MQRTLTNDVGSPLLSTALLDSTGSVQQKKLHHGGGTVVSHHSLAAHAPPRVWNTQAVVRTGALIVGFLVFGIGNNVGATMQGYVMPTFPSWLLYFTTVMYTCMFGALAVYRGEQPFSKAELTRAKFRQYILAAVWTAANGLLFQFANVWVDGDLQQVLVNLSVPFTFVVAWFYFPERRHTTVVERIGYALVMAGIVVGMIPSFQSMVSGSSSHESNQWYWVLAFVASIVFGALQEVQQDYAFEPERDCKKATMLFWFNLMSLPAYLVTIPCEAVAYLNGTTESTSVSDAFANQARAFQCYGNHPAADDVAAGNCLPLSWLWPSVFVVAYTGFFFLYAVLITEFGVVMATILSSLVPILAAAVFDSAAIVGTANQRDFQWPLGLSFAIIIVGIAVKSWAQYSAEQHKTEATRRAGGDADGGGIEADDTTKLATATVSGGKALQQPQPQQQGLAVVVVRPDGSSASARHWPHQPLPSTAAAATAATATASASAPEYDS